MTHNKNAFLIINSILFITIASSIAYAAPPNTYSDYWNFNNGTGTLNTTSGNGILTTVVNAPTAVAGMVGNASDFERSSSQYFYTNTAPVNFAKGYVIGAWLNPESVGTNAICAQGAMTTWLSGYNQTSNTGFYACTNSNGGITVNRQRSGVANDELKINVTIGTGQWTHVCIGYDESIGNLSVWYNGTWKGSIIKTGNGSSGGAATRVTVGALWDGGFSGMYDGKIDGLTFYQSSNASGLCPALYNAGTAIEAPFTPAVNTITLTPTIPLNLSYTYNVTPPFSVTTSGVTGTWNLTLLLNGTSYGTYNGLTTDTTIVFNSSTIASGKDYLWWVNATEASVATNSYISEKRNIYIAGAAANSCVATVRTCLFSSGSIGLSSASNCV